MGQNNSCGAGGREHFFNATGPAQIQLVAQGPNNFMACAWLIPSPNGHIQALDNPHALQLAIVSDGAGGAKAVLGYYVNGSASVQANLQTLTTGAVNPGVGGDLLHTQRAVRRNLGHYS